MILDLSLHTESNRSVVLPPFNQFHKKPSPKTIFKNLIADLSERYQTERQFKNCIKYLENNETELALESLIELAEETGESFAEKFWQELSKAAELMQQKDHAKFCKAKVANSKK